MQNKNFDLDHVFCLGIQKPLKNAILKFSILWDKLFLHQNIR